MRYVAGQITISNQLFDEAKRTEDAYKELEWIARHYDEATDEQRARWDRFSEAVDRMDDARLDAKEAAEATSPTTAFTRRAALPLAAPNAPHDPPAACQHP